MINPAFIDNNGKFMSDPLVPIVPSTTQLPPLVAIRYQDAVPLAIAVAFAGGSDREY